MLIPSKKPSVNWWLPYRFLCSGHLYQNHLEPGSQPLRLDWPLPFSGSHGRKCLVAFVTASKFPTSESERQWPYMVITPVPSSWLHTSHLRRQSRSEGEERRKLPQSLFLWGTETVKILAEDSKSPPFLQQSLLVMHVNYRQSETYWKKIARFYVYKLWIVLLRK